MQRVLKYFEWEEKWWKDLVDQHNEILDAPLMEGLAAYAKRQADLHHRLQQHCSYLWRNVRDWIKDGQIPAGRNWYSALGSGKSPAMYQY
jgi:hypothetical protein